MSHLTENTKVAVHLHLHYVDLLPELIPYLQNIAFPFDLYITITDSNSVHYANNICKKGLKKTKVYVVVVENKGRDVKPFYTDLRESIVQYDFVCHIHGKKSLFNNGATKGWLDHLLSNLLGSKEIVEVILRKLNEAPTGLIYPPTFQGIPYWAHNWLSNLGHALRLQPRLGIKHLPKSYFSYPVGNMFWAKVEAIKPLFDLNLSSDDYPPENKQNDGEIMHALERLVSVVATDKGFTNLIVNTEDGHPRFSIAEDAIDYTAYHNNPLGNLMHYVGLPHVKLISFDVFDTLVCRNLLEPDDMFDLMNNEVNKIVGKKVPFREIRKKADAALRPALKQRCDINLDDIYTEIGRVLQVDKSIVNELKKLELRFEEKFLCKRSSVADVMQHAYNIGKRVVLTSDMYLTEKQLTSLLTKLGINAFHKVYISSDVGCRKDTRTLFPHILEQEGVQPNEMIHIGDNEHSDMQIPGDLGIVTFHVRRVKDLFLETRLGKDVYNKYIHDLSIYHKASLALALNKFFDNPFPKSRSLCNGNLELFGYFYFGPALLSFVKWIGDTAKKENIEKLYFLSRDGEILYKIYKLLSRRQPDRFPKSKYLEISRRSLAVPFIRNNNDIDKALDAHYFGDTLKNFFHIRLGIDISNLKEKKLQEYGFENADTRVYIPQDFEKLRSLAHAIYQKHKNDFKKERKLVINYLQSKKLFTNAPKAIVDIGYSGTMQRLLNNITGKPVHGFYMITYNRIQSLINKKNILTKGLFGDNIDPISQDLSINKYSLFYEMILSSVNGPVENYKIKKGKCRPAYEAVSEDEKGKIEKLPIIHKGILDFCKDFCSLFEDLDLIDYKNLDLLQEPFKHFLEHPEPEDIMMLSGYTVDDHYCGNGILYWVPNQESLLNKSFDERKFLWGQAIDKLYPERQNKQYQPVVAQNGYFETPLDKEIFDWYNKEYEVLPAWYKKVGQMVKLAKGTKKMKIVFEDKPPKNGFQSKAEEIQSWYNKEYEVLPSWYKKTGHILKIMTGKRKLKDYL